MNSEFSQINFNSSPGSILDIVNTNELEIFDSNFFNIKSFSAGTIIRAYNLKHFNSSFSNFQYISTFD
jgi:hypothetical protein